MSVSFAGQIDGLTDENIFATWTQDLMKSRFPAWWINIVSPAPSCSSTGGGVVTSRKDTKAWWEAMIECASYLLVIITRITLHRQAAPSESQSAGCSLLSLLEQIGSTHLKGRAHSKFLLIWSLPLVSISRKRHCRETGQTSPAGVACVLLSPQCSGMLMYLVYLRTVAEQADFALCILGWALNLLSTVCVGVCLVTISPKLVLILLYPSETGANLKALLLIESVACLIKY